MKIFNLLFLIFFSAAAATAQYTVSGTVTSESGPVPFASVAIEKLQSGTVCDENGRFALKNIPAGQHLITISCVGYERFQKRADVSADMNLRLRIEPSSSTLNAVVITGTQQEMTKMESPIPVEVYHPSFFKKNPTPGIFEALNMVNGVQPQLNCNVCNTGDIHINGMEGPYTMVLIDGMPIVSSLATVYGLSGIPNSMVKRIEIVKGPASTVYGSEAVGGLINIITKEPATSPKFMFDLSSTSHGEFNADVSTKFRAGKFNSLTGVNAFWYDSPRDVNEDNFTDYTLQKRISVFNKWDYRSPEGRNTSLAFRYFYEDRWGGEMNWSPKWRGTDSIYGESIYTNRAEVIGRYELPVKANLTFQYSYNFHRQNSYYGITKYFADQHTAFGQLVWQKKTGRHDVTAGIPLRYIHYDDNTPGTMSVQNDRSTNEPAITVLPGIFVQDEVKLDTKLTVMPGLRYDRHNEHGNILTPRMSFKYMASKDHTVRLTGGNGFRVVNLFTEDHASLTGARKVVIAEELEPEQSWNVNFNYTGFINHKKGYLGIDASVFFTYFTNKIFGDFFSDLTLIVYDNLDGHAISKGVTLNMDFSMTNGFKLTAGITLMDVYEVSEDSAGNHIKTPQLFAPDFSGTFAASYVFASKGITFDLTGRVNGPMHLPVVPNDFRPDMSPWYAILNFQVTKKFPCGLEIYTGVKNILNFIPKNPILRPFDPFNKQTHVDNPQGYVFDPSYNYAPVQGSRIMIGLRWSIF